MNVATIEVPRAEAVTKLREYRARVHRRADDEYRRVEAAYEAAAKGRPLVVLSQVFETVPRDGKARPKLAICRADQVEVRYKRESRHEQFDCPHVWQWNRRGRVPNGGSISVPRPESQRGMIRHSGGFEHDIAWPSGYSLVPMVPPSVRDGHDLSQRFVLWEVEQWADHPHSAQPDRDPYLLQHISDDLYAVVGEWDLTPLEQAIMRDRARV
jgi:hypothetical protein